MSEPVVITQPYAEPVTVADAKAFLRYEQADQDAVFLTLLKAARDEVEREIRRPIVSRQYEVFFDARHGHAPLELPRPPVISISSVTTYDVDDTATTVATSNYRLKSFNPARLVAVDGGWTLDRTIDALRVRYVAGYVPVGKASGAGSATTTFTADRDLFNASMIGQPVVVAGYISAGDGVTVASVTSATVCELSTASTWADTAQVTIGVVPPSIEVALLQAFARLAMYRLPWIESLAGQVLQYNSDLLWDYRYDVV